MRKGTYTYQHPVYGTRGRVYDTFTMDVTIEAEKGNRFHIKYLGQHASGAAMGSLHWVRKDKVTETYEGGVAVATVKATKTDSGRIQFDVDNIRLPYKD